MADDAAAELDTLYNPPHERTVAKDIGWIDPHGRRFVELSPFVALATVGPNGTVDVSPRGGGPGFVHVAEDGKSLTLPDRPGNNRLDSLRNVTEGSGEVGLMFMIPGVDDIYRVNGPASLVVDEAAHRLMMRGGQPQLGVAAPRSRTPGRRVTPGTVMDR